MNMKSLVIAALTLSASASFASSVTCSVTEAIADSLFTQHVIVQDNSTVFVTTTSQQTKGFVSFSSNHVVINFYDVNEQKATYSVTEVAANQEVSLVFVPQTDSARTTTVVCKVQE